MPLIIGLTGQVGCGKGTVSAYLQERYDAKGLKFSAYLKHVIDAIHLDPSRDHFVKMSEVLRAGFGDDVLSRAVAHDAAHTDVPLVVIDGIRRVADLVALAPLPGFTLVAVESDARTRYERIAGRGEKSDERTLTWEQFATNEQRSTEQTIPEVMAQASIHLRNDGTLEAIQQQVDEMMRQLNPSLY